jgi:hypothetical protein
MCSRFRAAGVACMLVATSLAAGAALSGSGASQCPGSAPRACAQCLVPVLLSGPSDVVVSTWSFNLPHVHASRVGSQVRPLRGRAVDDPFGCRGTPRVLGAQRAQEGPQILQSQAYIVQTAEKKALMGLYNYFQEAGVTVVTLLQ